MPCASSLTDPRCLRVEKFSFHPRLRYSRTGLSRYIATWSGLAYAVIATLVVHHHSTAEHWWVPDERKIPLLRSSLPYPVHDDCLYYYQ
jgi:hypothetical protein